MACKQPRSVQVVVFADDGEGRAYLLLRRISTHGGFWQSVTGSLEPDETHLQAAKREVLEETGFELDESAIIPLDLVSRFEIAPQWRAKYAPGITHNEEVCFAARVERRSDVRLDPNEHDAFQWVHFGEAAEMLYWESNKRALEATLKLFRLT
jgi:dATP pyrophosphohydrolase